MRERSVGMMESLAGASMWGVSSVAANLLFSITTIPYLALLFVRVIFSSLILFIFIKPRIKIGGLLGISIFGIIGLFGSQLTYLAAIYYSNAATATVLQYLFMPMVVIYDLLRRNRKVSFVLIISIIFSFAGLILLTINFSSIGSVLVVSPTALFFGLMAAVSAAFYTIYARPLIKKQGFEATISLGFLMACIPATFVGLYPSIEYFRALSAQPAGSILIIAGLIAFIIVIGTAGAYYLYVRSIKHISSSDASITASMEPISSAVFSLLVLGIFLTDIQYIGVAIIILSISFIQRDSTAGN
ncbi:MAG: DMT family transporter [Thermoplasmataceae archaeon]|jgi:drug/metabolite transporter (DMT)-like permease